MSQLALTGNASGSGTFTIAAPNSNSNRTLDLPDAAGTIVTDTATQTLTNKSIAATQLTGTIAAARLPVGSVVQVVSAGTSTGVTVTSTTETDTGVTATITPTSTSNKILVLVTMMGVFKSSGNADNRVHLRLKRGTTTINDSGGNFHTTTALNQRGAIAISNLDSPATTSATTYKVTFNNDENAAEVSVQRDSNSGTSTITLMEIVA
jgi:hypothetical protein